MRGLGQLEATIMDVIWQASDAITVREVVDRLQRERSIAYTTVMTVMDNLHSKGMLARERVGRAYAYRSTRPREQYEAELMEGVLAASSDRSATLLHFVDSISPQELAILRTALDGLDERDRR